MPSPCLVRASRRPLAALVVGFALALGACGGATGPSPPDAPLEVLVPNAPTSFDPRFTTDATGVRISRLLHAGLVGLDPATLDPVPLAASSWRWEGPRDLVFTLRPGIHFASGAPLDPDDVCATLAAVADPAFASPHRAVASSIRACTPLDGHRVRISLGRPRATLVTDMEIPIVRKEEARAPHRPFGPLDGLGPYAVRAASPNAIVLASRDGGVAPKPSRDAVIRVVHDENARALRLLAGRADIVPNGFAPPLLRALEAQGARITSRTGANLTYLVPNHARPPFSDLRARRAASLAIDRPRLARTLFDGHAREAANVLPPESWAAPPSEPRLVFDPNAARSLFAEAGARRVSLLVSTDRARGTLARAMAQMLGDAGLEVEVISLELGVLLSRLEQGDFELALLQLPEIAEPNVLRLFFHSDAIPHDGAGANRARYASADVDAWLELASREPDRETRAPLYARALARMRDDVAVIPLFHEDQIAAVGPRATGFTLSAEGRWMSLATLP